MQPNAPADFARPDDESQPNLTAQWRRLAIDLYCAVDQALDSTDRERVEILTEAATTADALIDDLDAKGRAA